MVQAARSGVQNIAEGSQASATSKKTELKLTNVARASLEELRLDYEDFLRQRGLPLWDRKDARRESLIARRCTTADCVAQWVREQSGLGGLGGPSGLKQNSKANPTQNAKPPLAENTTEPSSQNPKPPSTPSTQSTKSTPSTYPEI